MSAVDPVALGADPSGTAGFGARLLRGRAERARRGAALRPVRAFACGPACVRDAVAGAGGLHGAGAGCRQSRAAMFVAEEQHDVLVTWMLLDGNRDAIGSDAPLATSVSIRRASCSAASRCGTRAASGSPSRTRWNPAWPPSRFRDIGTFNGGRPIGTGGPFDPGFPGSAWMAVNFNDRGGNAPDPRDRDDFVLDTRFELLGGSAVAAAQQIGFLFARNMVDNRASGWSAGQQAALGTSFAGIYLHLTAGALVIGNSIAGVSGDGIDTLREQRSRRDRQCRDGKRARRDRHRGAGAALRRARQCRARQLPRGRACAPATPMRMPPSPSARSR